MRCAGSVQRPVATSFVDGVPMAKRATPSTILVEDRILRGSAAFELTQQLTGQGGALARRRVRARGGSPEALLTSLIPTFTRWLLLTR